MTKRKTRKSLVNKDQIFRLSENESTLPILREMQAEIDPSMNDRQSSHLMIPSIETTPLDEKYTGKMMSPKVQQTKPEFNIEADQQEEEMGEEEKIILEMVKSKLKEARNKRNTGLEQKTQDNISQTVQDNIVE